MRRDPLERGPSIPALRHSSLRAPAGLSSPLADKWRAFGWTVREFDGHAMGEVVAALEALPLHPQRPTALIAHTIKGKGVSFAEDTYVWHSNSVNDEILARALAELGAP